ncbi:MAG: hypothetical protein IJ572_02180 [Bacilli bacterium]|nr:hypothetical protein [Bacilli bacterium]
MKKNIIIIILSIILLVLIILTFTIKYESICEEKENEYICTGTRNIFDEDNNIIDKQDVKNIIQYDNTGQVTHYYTGYINHYSSPSDCDKDVEYMKKNGFTFSKEDKTSIFIYDDNINNEEEDYKIWFKDLIEDVNNEEYNITCKKSK